MTLRSIFCLRTREAKIKFNWFHEAAARLAEAPHASTLEAAIKRILGGHVPHGTKEAISASTNAIALVKSKESSKITFKASMREDAGVVTSESQNKFRVVLIEEGMGNFGNAFYYTKEALENAIPIFTGLKIMADHPSLDEEETRPERSTRDILGHYENLALEESGGRSMLCGDVDILPSPDCDWARVRMIRALENASKFPDKPFIGLSINAWGDSQNTPIDEVISKAPEGAKAKLIEAKENGIELVKVVHQLKGAISCDLVTEAGAGGKILNIIGEEDGKEEAG